MTTYTTAKPAGTPTWIDLMTPDVEAARRFYQALFGWEYDIASPEFGGYTTARVGNRMAAGMSGPMPGAPPMPAAWNLYFASADAAADTARAVGMGAKVIAPAMAVGDFGSMAVLVDPGGAAFSFWQAGQTLGVEVTDEPGSMTWCELYAANAKQSRDFYAGILGATIDPMPGGMEYYVLKHGEAMLGGIMQIEPSWGDFHPQWMIYFAVANADETVAIATRQGGKSMAKVEDSPFGRIGVLMDPAGASFKILQPPAR